MNLVQNLIDRQIGILNRFHYDNVLTRLMVREDESYYGLQSGAAGIGSLDQDPPIFACRFAETSGYEHILALANEDGRVAIQDTSKIGASLDGFQCHNNAVFDLAWMPGQMSFVTVSGDHTASLWDLADGSPKRALVFSSHTKSVKTVVFRPSEPSVFATGARDGHILLWDLRASSQPHLAVRPDNRLTGCHSSFVPKTPGSHGKRPRLDTQRATSITGLVFRDDHTLISCGECDGNIKVWDLRKNYNIYKREPLPKHSIPYCGSSTKNGYTNLIVDDSRVRLYASCMDDVVYCFNVSTYSQLPERRYVGHETRTFYIKTCLSGDGQYLVSGSSDRCAYVWRVRRSRPLLRLAGHNAEVTCAALSRADPPVLVTCSDDARHLVWRLGPESPSSAAGPRAEPAPRGPDPPCWGPPTPPPPAPRAARRAPASKRCLLELLDPGTSSKRPRPEPPAYTARSEPLELQAVNEARSEPRPMAAGCKRPRDPSPEPADPCCSFTTPTKDYSRRSYRLSPRTPRRSPSKSPKFTVTLIRTPTKNLPNFVLDGEAPHHRLMSPPKKRHGTTDWLTAIRKKSKTSDGDKTAAPSSPKETTPNRRNSTTEKTPKSNKKSRTLLKYFSVTNKDKC